MEFLGGALPNVMFIIGILAIGLGLGIELKLVALNKEIDKTGRVGAIIIGALLIAASLFLYLNPALTNRNPVSSATANAALPPAAANSTPAQLASTAVPAVDTITAPLEAPTALVAPTAIVAPTDLPPTPTPAPPTATTVPIVKVPDLHDLGEKDAQNKLKAAGLNFSKVDQCNGTDRGDSRTKKQRIQCQNPAADAEVLPGTTVEYVIR